LQLNKSALTTWLLRPLICSAVILLASLHTLSSGPSSPLPFLSIVGSRPRRAPATSCCSTCGL
jgi:hypothetical protein